LEENKRKTRKYLSQTIVEKYKAIQGDKGNMLDEKVRELIDIGASVSANCHPCVKYHVTKARQMKIDETEIQQALEVGKMVRKGAAGQMDELISEIRK